MLAAALNRLAFGQLLVVSKTLDQKENQIAFTVVKESSTENDRLPYVIALHGIGDTSSTYRFLVPHITRVGFTVVAPDLRGCGKSSAHFSSYKPEEAAKDAFAVMENVAGSADALDQRGVVIVGHSYSAASAVWMAAERPKAVRGVIFIGPFVRDPNEGKGLGAGLKALLGAMFAWPWGASMWAAYYRDSLHKEPKLDRKELQHHTNEIYNSLDSSHLHALRKMMDATKKQCEDRLSEVKAPSLTIIGSADPDYAVPENEAKFIVESLASTGRAEYKMVNGSGHYPFFEQPQETADHVVSFLKSITESS